MTAKTVVDVILGEAKAGSYQDMLAIASVISNRATGARTSWQDVVARTSEFNAYGKPLPSGVNQYRSMAQKAINQVKTTGPVHNATFYATPKAQRNLPKGLERVTATDGHIYFTDPQHRSIYTASGLKQIDYQQVNNSTPKMLAYNDAGLPDVAPIPAGLFTATPKGLAALVPSQNQSNLTDYLTSDKGPSHVEGLKPEFQSRLGPFLRTVDNTQILSGYRSPEHQKRLFDRAVKKYGSAAAARKWVAPPGRSNHNKGIAADLSYGDAAARNRAHKEAESFGLTFRMSHEPWHIEPIKGWDRQVNQEFGKTPASPPTPQPRNTSQTFAAPRGEVQREELGPASITPAPSGNVTRAGSLPQAKPQEATNPTARKLQVAYQKNNVPTPVARPTDIPKPTYTPKASDYSNYMMNVKQPTIPTPAARPADLGPMAVIDGPVGKPVQSVPIPAPTLKRESRFDKAKRTFGNNLKEQLKPETIAARGAGALIGGLLGGPMGAKAGQMFGPQIAKQLNNRNGGLFGMFNNQQPDIYRSGQTMGSSSSEWGNSQNKGATYSASDGATITGLGNGTYARTNPITGGTSYWNEDGSRSTKGY
jgi:hypothetical protein